MFFTWVVVSLMWFWASVVVVVLDIHGIVSPIATAIVITISSLNSIGLSVTVWWAIEKPREFDKWLEKRQKRNRNK